MLAFVHRMPCREDDSSTAKDLSQVRSGGLDVTETDTCFCLRLIKYWLYYVYVFFQQLHSSVRTGNLETCLRLLSLGAQANFFHPVRFISCLEAASSSLRLCELEAVCFARSFQEKGNTPLHVAARAGQASQAELLAVYGADPGAPDSNGKTPPDYARLVMTCNVSYFK